MALTKAKNNDSTFDPIGSELAHWNVVLSKLIGKCQQTAAAAMESDAKSIDLLHKALADVLELFDLSKSNAIAEGELHELLKQSNIATDGRTKNEFTPLIKLAFGPSSKTSNINRNASAVRHAFERGVHSDSLADFFREQGGVARCAELDRKSRALKRPSWGNREGSRHLRPLNSTIITLESGLALPKSRLFSLLVERCHACQFRVLGAKVEDDTTVSQYLGSDATDALNSPQDLHSPQIAAAEMPWVVQLRHRI